MYASIRVPSEDSWQVKGSALRSSQLPVRGSFLSKQQHMKKLHLNCTLRQRLGSTVTACWQIVCSSSQKQVGRSRFQHLCSSGCSQPFATDRNLPNVVKFKQSHPFPVSPMSSCYADSSHFTCSNKGVPSVATICL